MLNAGRGNPNWIATTPREAFFKLGQFGIEECRLAMNNSVDMAGVPQKSGIAKRFEDFLQANAQQPTYNNMQKNIEVDLFKKTGKYSALGIITNAMEVSVVNFSEVSLLGNESRKTTAVGMGLIVSYDSRDFIPNPYKGTYAMASNTYYAGALGSTHGFNKIDLIFRCYKQLRKGTILAFDLDGTFNMGNVNWGMMALVGSPNQMRGYYQGRYRDKKLIDTQVEIRQHVYKRSGVVAWAGAGNAFSKFTTVQLCQTLPTYGAGYRFELKERVNLRLDYGRGKDQSAFYININEAF